MVLINYTVREISTKIVYYGPGLSGKTTNIQAIHGRIQPENRGKLVSLATETDRTLFFDFFPIDFGTIGGFKVRFHFYTVPGQVFYNSTRKLVLKGADGVVFVADSQKNMEDSNIESLINLKENLDEIGIDLDEFPFVIQYNKRDLPNLLSIEELQKELNPNDVPYYEACAVTGEGIMETMKAISKIALQKISESKGIGGKKPARKPAAKPDSELSATEKVKQAIREGRKDKDLSEPATPPEPARKPAAKAAPPKEVKKEEEIPAPVEEAVVVEEEKATVDVKTPVIIKLDTDGAAIPVEIVLPQNLHAQGEVPYSLPLILELPKDTHASKLNVNLSVSYINKEGVVLNPSYARKKKKRGLFGWGKK